MFRELDDCQPEKQMKSSDLSIDNPIGISHVDRLVELTNDSQDATVKISAKPRWLQHIATSCLC